MDSIDAAFAAAAAAARRVYAAVDDVHGARHAVQAASSDEHHAILADQEHFLDLYHARLGIATNDIIHEYSESAREVDDVINLDPIGAGVAAIRAARAGVHRASQAAQRAYTGALSRMFDARDRFGEANEHARGLCGRTKAFSVRRDALALNAARVKYETTHAVSGEPHRSSLAGSSLEEARVAEEDAREALEDAREARDAAQVEEREDRDGVDCGGCKGHAAVLNMFEAQRRDREGRMKQALIAAPLLVKDLLIALNPK